MLHMPSPTLFGGEPQKTYAEFVAHIAALAVDGAVAWATSVTASGAFRTTMAAYSGNMYGSPYNGRFETIENYNRSALPRVIQHSLPATSAAGEGTEVFFRAQADFGFWNLIGINRNGYVSLSQDQRPAGRVTELIYWDGAQAQRMQPSLGLGPEPYTW